MATVIIKNQPASVTAVPGENTTFFVIPSADFSPASYAYQWLRDNVNINGATSSSYFIDPLSADNGASFTAAVSALSGSPLTTVATVTSNPAVLTVAADAGPYQFWAVYPESGEERHTRLRHLGYV